MVHFSNPQLLHSTLCSLLHEQPPSAKGAEGGDDETCQSRGTSVRFFYTKKETICKLVQWPPLAGSEFTVAELL